MGVRTSRVRGRSAALMQGLMMNLPIELDANGNPKVIDLSVFDHASCMFKYKQKNERRYKYVRTN